MKNLDPEAPVFVDDPLAPIFFADGVVGYQMCGDLVRISLGTYVTDHTTTPGPMNTVCIGRLIMSPAAARVMAVELLGFLTTYSEEPASAGPPTQTKTGTVN